MKKYVCDVCGYVYDPEAGDPDSGIQPGTAFEDIPEDWVCPICGVGKSDFSPESAEVQLYTEYSFDAAISSAKTALRRKSVLLPVISSCLRALVIATFNLRSITRPSSRKQLEVRKSS